MWWNRSDAKPEKSALRRGNARAAGSPPWRRGRAVDYAVTGRHLPMSAGLTIQGRDCTMDVIEVPDSAPVLIGKFPWNISTSWSTPSVDD